MIASSSVSPFPLRPLSLPAFHHLLRPSPDRDHCGCLVRPPHGCRDWTRVTMRTSLARCLATATATEDRFAYNNDLHSITRAPQRAALLARWGAVDTAGKDRHGTVTVRHASTRSSWLGPIFPGPSPITTAPPSRDMSRTAFGVAAHLSVVSPASNFFITSSSIAARFSAAASVASTCERRGIGGTAHCTEHCTFP